MHKKLSLGSLFDGSGGFPLAAMRYGIEAKWASEIEPFPIRVTRKNFPSMKHLGDVSTIDGAAIEPVDIISFGSPCTDLSIAGKREGLVGSASSLFFQAIRIIKEMREKTNDQYPRFIIWENVLGAYTSNKGRDFQEVLEQIISIKAPQAKVPMPDKNKWPRADLYLGDGWSLAYRTLDAQYWGVPQRRQRIFLVADFGGGSAGKILFESKGVSRDFETSETSESRTPSSTQDSTREPSDNKPLVFDNHGNDSRYKGPVTISQTLTARLGTGGNNQPFVLEKKDWPKIFDVRISSENTKNVRHNVYETSTSRTVDTAGNQPSSNQGGVAIVGVNKTYSTSKNAHHTRATEELTSSLVASDYKDPPVVNQKHKQLNLYVRRITPIECARLQGFPDDWCEGLVNESPDDEELLFWKDVFDTYSKATGKGPRTLKSIKNWLSSPPPDSAQYKMWGNGVALPCVEFIFKQITAQFNE